MNARGKLKKCSAIAPLLSRRQLLQQGVVSFVAGTLASGVMRAAAQGVAPLAAEALPAEIVAVMQRPRYRFSRWGLHVAGRASGEVIYDVRGGERFLAASMTKLFAGAAALDAYGPNYRFETPIYRRGDVSADGELRGDLILVASGDPTMGGRTTPQGTIAFTADDHMNATALPTSTLTLEDPLAGLDALARQVAASGIRRVNGEVIVDARLFPAMKKDGYVLTPIWINDNLIDLTITPGRVGEKAAVAWRPETAAYRLQADVQTIAAGQPLNVKVSSSSPGVIAVSGGIPADHGPLVQVYQVEDPPAFARTLLIEALRRRGVVVAASATGSNPAERLPPPGSYTRPDRVALLTSPPFSENIKLIFKVSHNQHADLLLFLLALKQGETGFEAGLVGIRSFLRRVGLDTDEVSLSDGRGGEFTNLFSPRTAAQLLRIMATRPDFPAYLSALPGLGVDGSESITVPRSSPLAGQAAAKSGTTIAGDFLNQRPLVMTRGLAGYMTSQRGQKLVFMICVSDVPLTDQLVDDTVAIIKEQGKILEMIYALH